MHKPLLLLLALAGCSNGPCYNPEQCFAADQARRDRGIAMMAIGAGMMAPRPNYYFVRGW